MRNTIMCVVLTILGIGMSWWGYGIMSAARASLEWPIAQGIVKVQKKSNKPMACSFMGASDVQVGIDILEQAHIPHYILPELACKAMANVQRVCKWRQTELTDFASLPVDKATAQAIIKDLPKGYLREDQALAVLNLLWNNIRAATARYYRNAVMQFGRYSGGKFHLSLTDGAESHETVEVGDVSDLLLGGWKFDAEEQMPIIEKNELVGSRVRIVYIGRQAVEWGGHWRKIYRVYKIERSRSGRNVALKVSEKTKK